MAAPTPEERLDPSVVDPITARRILTRRQFVGGFAALSAVVAVYSTAFARHELETTYNTLFIRGLPDAFKGFRLVQISDIHLDEFTEPSFVEHVVAEVNRLAAPLVVVTGDYISRGPMPRDTSRHAMHPCADILSTLKAPLRYFILGNHDCGLDEEFVVNVLTSRGLPVLQNRYVAIDQGGARIWLSGVRDPGLSEPDLNAAIPAQPAAPVILLAHEPDYADKVRVHPRFGLVDAMLSGHSHGGQIRLPFSGPLILPPMGRKYPEGPRQIDHMQLYTNRGIGTAGVPFRLNCAPEITVHTLQRAANT